MDNAFYDGGGVGHGGAGHYAGNGGDPSAGVTGAGHPKVGKGDYTEEEGDRTDSENGRAGDESSRAEDDGKAACFRADENQHRLPSVEFGCPGDLKPEKLPTSLPGKLEEDLRGSRIRRLEDDVDSRLPRNMLVRYRYNCVKIAKHYEEEQDRERGARKENPHEKRGKGKGVAAKVKQDIIGLIGCTASYFERWVKIGKAIQHLVDGFGLGILGLVLNEISDFRILSLPVASLDLIVRAINCLHPAMDKLSALVEKYLWRHLGPYLRRSMLMTLARAVGNVDEAEIEKLVESNTFHDEKCLAKDEEDEIARRVEESHEER
ncbi:MAG: hypothetical protein M1839_003133 [Geoglossum umbratile]|nr:MAG: hypothetical protein M1839_003133 [Geoglossum umbratile]